jgi:hypothetical protein
MILIDKKVLGTESHLISDQGYFWTDDIPPGVWHLSREIKDGSDKCLNSLLRLNGASVDLSPGKKWVNSIETLTKIDSPPWRHILPRDEFLMFLERLVISVDETYPKLKTQFYNETWVPSAHVLRSLQPSKINLDRYSQILSLSGLNLNNLQSSFNPNGSFCPAVSYNRFGTRTGRLVVESGPPILTLKKEFRDVFESSYEGGSIISIDFSALESRIVLYESGGDNINPDLYHQIAMELFGSGDKRKIVKGAVLAEIYGASKSMLARTLGLDWGDLEVFTRRIKKYFKISELKDRLRKNWEDNNCIINRFGRRVSIETSADHILLNSYSQSTGVDVSLLGFSQIVKEFSGEGFRPLFVLHDALIVDVSDEKLHDLEGLKCISIPTFSQVFPLKIEKFSS